MPQEALAQRFEPETDVSPVPQPESDTGDGRPMTPAEIILERHARGAWYEWT